MAACRDMRSGYETFEHTADVGLLVRGVDLPDLFLQAALGFLYVMFGDAPVRRERTMPVRAEGHGPEVLLVAWLEEILYAFEVHRFVPAEVRLLSLEEGQARGELVGEAFDPERHELAAVVKAVTYHDLTINRRQGGFEVRIVLDV